VSDGRPLRVGHLTTIDMSLWLLLRTELRDAVAEGWDVFGLSAPGPNEDRLRELGVTPVAVPSLTRSWDLRSDGRAARELYRTLRGLDLDVLHTHNPKTGVIGRVAGRLARIPIVVNTCHGLWADADDPIAKRALVYGAEAAASVASDAELYQNDQDRRTLSRYVPTRKAWTVGNGVDLDRFVRDPAAGAALRAELGVAPDEILVGGVGRQVAEKGMFELADVARRLGDRATFVWIGPPDPDKPDAVDGEVDGLRLLGPRDDMVAVYSALDVFVLPTHREGFSRSGMEAAACATPMVLTDIRGCREIGTDGEHLLLVPPRDPDALAAAVTRLLDDPGLRRNLAAAAEARARRTFDQTAVATMSRDTYRRVALRRGLDLPL